jgi:hypothetical protein
MVDNLDQSVLETADKEYGCKISLVTNQEPVSCHVELTKEMTGNDVALSISILTNALKDQFGGSFERIPIRYDGDGRIKELVFVQI